MKKLMSVKSMLQEILSNYVLLQFIMKMYISLPLIEYSEVEENM